MFGKDVVVDMIDRSAENGADRRNFLRTAGLAGLGVVGATTLAGTGGLAASAAPPSTKAAGAPSDGAVLNFALNLEYLEAEFYLHAYYGWGVPSALTDGKGTRGGVTGGRKVPFKSRAIAQYAREIAEDELNHVAFLRKALGSAAVARPKIDLRGSFTAAARAAAVKLALRSIRGRATAAVPSALRRNATWFSSSSAISRAYWAIALLLNGTLRPPVTPPRVPLPLVRELGTPHP